MCMSLRSHTSAYWTSREWLGGRERSRSDCRENDSRTSTEATALGDAQWAWLERQLREPADVRLVCSSTKIVPDAKGMDEWAAFLASDSGCSI